jgi:hypothetical protein
MQVTGSSGAGAVSGADGGDAFSMTVAAKGLQQMKQDGRTAVALIAAAAPPPQGARGQNVNVLA